MIRAFVMFVAFIAVLVAQSIASPLPARADRVSRLLEVSAAALGGPALQRVKTLEQRGTVSVGGISGTGTSWQEIGGVRSSESYDVAPLEGGDGYDGTDVWNRDGSGLVWVDGGLSGRAQAISQAFASDYALWFPNRGGASVAWTGVKSAGGRKYDVLRVTAPNSAVPFDLWLDQTTHLPSRFVQTVGATTVVTIYSKYHSVDGLMIPYASLTQGSDGNTTQAAVTQAVANPADAPAHLRKPASDVHDFSIARGASRTSVPIDLVDNHVYLSVMLNGKGPYRFIYDTGGANIVDPAVAQEIGATGHGSLQGGGVGSKTESVSFAKVSSLQIGAATIGNQLFGVAPTRLGFGISSGKPVDGLIGFEVLSRFVTTFDYADGSVILSMPSSVAQPLPNGARTLPFVFDERQPQFACGIDGIASQCTLDTGARNSISLMAPFIAAHPQIVPTALSAVGVNGFGFGGPALGKLGRLQSLTFGSFMLTDVIADFSAQRKGAFAAPFVAANVGGNIWKRFTLTLDYGRQTIVLTPNASFDQPDFYERAGLFLLNRGGKYVVLDSRPGTPAAQAGIVAGDVIDTIDGRPVGGISLQAIRELFLGAAGTSIRIGLVGKDGATRSVTVTLRDYV